MTEEFVSCLCECIIHGQIHPKDIASTIEDALKLFEMAPWELKACRQKKTFSEVEINGIIYFDTKELLSWGYWNRQESKHVQAYWRQTEMGDNHFNCDRI
jgi:hypothetical protein